MVVFFLVFQSVWPISGLFLALFSFLLKFSSGKTELGCQTCERIVRLLVFISGVSMQTGGHSKI